MRVLTGHIVHAHDLPASTVSRDVWIIRTVCVAHHVCHFRPVYVRSIMEYLGPRQGTQCILVGLE